MGGGKVPPWVRRRVRYAERSCSTAARTVKTVIAVIAATQPDAAGRAVAATEVSAAHFTARHTIRSREYQWPKETGFLFPAFATNLNPALVTRRGPFRQLISKVQRLIRRQGNGRCQFAVFKLDAREQVH